MAISARRMLRQAAAVFPSRTRADRSARLAALTFPAI